MDVQSKIANGKYGEISLFNLIEKFQSFLNFWFFLNQLNDVICVILSFMKVLSI